MDHDVTMSAPVLAERARLAALHRYGVLDTPREASFDRLARLAARVMGMPIAAVTLVDAERVWFKAEIGLGATEVPRHIGLCSRTVAASGPVLEISDSWADETLVGNPLLGPPVDLRFYAGAALVTPDGFRIGTLCVIDRVARPGLTAEQRATLIDLAGAVMTELERRRQERLQERATARLALINDILALVGSATGFVAAIEAAIARLCRYTGALNGHLWDNVAGPGVRVLAFAAPQEVGPRQRAEFFAAFAESSKGVTGSVMPADDAPLILPEVTEAGANEWPLIRFGREFGMRAFLLHPLGVGGARFGLALTFGTPREDLQDVADLLADVGQAIRPALQRKQAEDRLALLHEVLASVAEAPGFRQAIDAALRRLCEHAGALWGLMWDKVDGADQLRLVAVQGGAGAPDDLYERVAAAFPLAASKSILAPLLEAEGQRLMPRLTQEMTARFPLIGLGRAAGMRSLAARSFVVGPRRYVLVFTFATERSDLDQVADLLAEVGRAIRPALQRKQVEERLALLQAAVDATADAVVITDARPTPPADRGVLHVNPAFTRMTGYRPEDVLGRNLRFLQGRDTDPAAVARLRAAVDGHRAAREELLNYRRDGTPFWVELDIAPFADERGEVANWVGVLRDTTERRATQEALQRVAGELRERTAQLTEVARLARIGSWIWRAGHNAMEWSEETYEVLGVARETFTPTVEAFLSQLDPRDAPRARAACWQAVQSGHSVHLELRVKPSAGRVREIIWNGTARQAADGRTVELRGYCQDVTERREAEAALRHGEKLRALGKLTGGIAHEFNNLLTVVQANLEMALDDSETLAEARPELEAARRAALAGTELTGRLLSFARSEPLRSEPTDVNAWLGPLRDMATRTLGQRYRITLRDDPGLPPVTVDRSQLEGAVLNLILNARDAMPTGGTIAIETERMEVPPGARGALADLLPGSYAVVAVRDNGAGMPAEVAERAFEPFFTTKPVGSGTGLGLSMVLSFTRQSGGTTLIETAQGSGTVVRIVLPLR